MIPLYHPIKNLSLAWIEVIAWTLLSFPLWFLKWETLQSHCRELGNLLGLWCGEEDLTFLVCKPMPLCLASQQRSLIVCFTKKIKYCLIFRVTCSEIDCKMLWD